MILRASKTQIKGDFIEVLVHGERTKRKLLPREGWEELETGFYVLSKTRKWVKPLFLLRKRGELVAYEGRTRVDAARAAEKCKLCGRELDVEGDELSVDCGGDCWGCIEEIERELGEEE